MRRAVEKATDQPYGQDMTRWKVQPDPDGSWSIVDEKGQAQATGIISKRRAENKLGTMRKPKTAAQAIGETVSRVSKRSFAAGQEHALATGNTIWEDKIGAKLDQESRPQTIQELVDMSIGQGKRLGKEEVYAQSRLPEDVARAAVNDVLEATKGDDKTRTQRLMEMHDALAQAEMRDEKMNPEEAARKGLEAMIKNPARRAALLASKGGKAGEVLGALRKVLDKALNEHFGKELARMMRKNPQRLYNSELVGRWENIAGEKTPLGKLATTAKSYRLAKGKLEKWKALNRPAGEIEKQQALVDEIKQRLGQMSRKINWQEARTAFNELSTIWQESRSMREKVLEDQDTTRGEIVTRAEKESINARDPLEEWTKEGKTHIFILNYPGVA
jgi:hypothetical protein